EVLYFDGASRIETGPDGSQRRRAGAGIYEALICGLLLALSMDILHFNIYEGSWKNLIIFISLTLREPAQIKIEESDWRKPFLDYFNHGILPKDLNRRDWHDRLFEALWAYRVSSYPLKAYDKLVKHRVFRKGELVLKGKLSIDVIFYPFLFLFYFYYYYLQKSSFVDATLQIHKKGHEEEAEVQVKIVLKIREIFTPLWEENTIDKRERETKYIHAYGLKIHVVAALRLEKLLCHQSFDIPMSILHKAILPLLVFLLLGSEAARPASP
ncbi:hypothetical protein ACJX0J_021319, partial [Zea mays]